MAEANYDTSFASVGKLQPLYAALIYKRLSSIPPTKEPTPLDVEGDSDFLKAVNGKNSVGIFAVMDELMEAIKILHPRTYNSVMQKIQDL